MKKVLKVILIIFGVLLLLVGLFIGWNIYNNRIDPEYQKFLPKTILSLQIEGVSRRPNTDNRIVETAKGQELVLLESGYRGYYRTPGKIQFLRIHPEGAPKGAFDEDLAVIQRQYAALAAEDKKYQFIKNTYKDHEYYLVGDPENETGGVRETGAIFFPEDSVLVTIYFFNQGPDSSKWDYKDGTEYKALRDNFIKLYIDSVLQSK